MLCGVNILIRFQTGVHLYMFSLSSQFHISASTSSNYVRTIHLPLASQESITKMVSSDNGEYIFAMTPSRVSILMHAGVCP